MTRSTISDPAATSYRNLVPDVAAQILVATHVPQVGMLCDLQEIVSCNSYSHCFAALSVTVYLGSEWLLYHFHKAMVRLLNHSGALSVTVYLGFEWLLYHFHTAMVRLLNHSAALSVTVPLDSERLFCHLHTPTLDLVNHRAAFSMTVSPGSELLLCPPQPPTVRFANHPLMLRLHCALHEKHSEQLFCHHALMAQLANQREGPCYQCAYSGRLFCYFQPSQMARFLNLQVLRQQEHHGKHSEQLFYHHQCVGFCWLICRQQVYRDKLACGERTTAMQWR